MNKDNNILDNNKEEFEQQNLFSIASQELEEEKNNISFSEVTEEIENDKEEISFGNLLHSVEQQEEREKLLIEEKTNSDNSDNELKENLVEKEHNSIEYEPNETNNKVAEELTENTEENPFVQTTEEEQKEPNPFVTNETNNKVVEDLTENTENQNENLEIQSIKNETINDALNTAKTKMEIENPFIIDEKEGKAPPAAEVSVINQQQNIQEKINPFFENNTFEGKDELEINPFFYNNKIELNETPNHKNTENNKLELNGVPHYNVKVQKKKPKKLKLILGVLSYAIFIWLLLIGIALLIYVANIKIRAMKGDYTPPKYNAYVVLTGSMLPQIEVEDVVVTKKVDAEELKEGDIITFASADERYYGTIITHRIMKKYYDSTTGKYTFQSKGDNNNVADNALVQEDLIYGKVILKIPKLGYLQVFLASKGGWILVILIPCLVVISFDIMKLFKMIARKRKLKIVK